MNLQVLKQIEEIVNSNPQCEFIEFDGKALRIKLLASGAYITARPYVSYTHYNSDKDVIIESRDIQMVQVGQPNQKYISLNYLNEFINQLAKV
jgi:hypothetical protein